MSKHVNHKEIFIAAALILLLVPGICAVYSGFKHTDEVYWNPVNERQDLDFAEEYPFSSNESAPETAGENTILKKIPAAVEKVTGYIDDCCGKYNIVSPFFYYLYGTTEKALGKDYIEDAEMPVIRLENGYLTYVYQYPEEPVDYTGISAFHEWLKGKDIPLLFVMPADKSDDRYAVYPEGFSTGYSEMENEYFTNLDDNGIPYMDTKEIFLSENNDFYSWFYITDHHWNVHAGFLVALAIAERLKTEFGLPVETDVLDRANFTVNAYENISLGSQGRKATHGYISPETFEVYEPLFDTAFSLEISTKMINRTGAFADTLINSNALKSGNYYINKCYAVFLYGDVPLAKIHNLNCENGTRVLVIKTSDANVVNTYLAFTVEYIDIIDPRHFDGSVRSYIEATHPDMVLICAFPSEILGYKLLDIN